MVYHIVGDGVGIVPFSSGMDASKKMVNPNHCCQWLESEKKKAEKVQSRTIFFGGFLHTFLHPVGGFGLGSFSGSAAPGYQMGRSLSCNPFSPPVTKSSDLRVEMWRGTKWRVPESWMSWASKNSLIHRVFDIYVSVCLGGLLKMIIYFF